MMSLWAAQIVAVIRMEMKKTFFSRRRLWVYLLALAPVALFLGALDFRDAAGRSKAKAGGTDDLDRGGAIDSTGNDARGSDRKTGRAE